MSRARHTVRLCVAGLTAAALAGVPIFEARAAAVEPTWEVTTDGGLSADDFAAFVETSDVTWNAGDRVYVAGDAALPAATGSVLNDRDVLVSAFDTATGASAWSTRFDNDRADDHLVDFHLDGNNNIAYAVINSGADTLIRKFSAWTGDLVTGSYPGVDIPGTRAADAAVSYPGGWIGVAGARGGQFYVTARGAGNDENEFEDVSVAGEALSVDIPRVDSTERTMMVTGRESVGGGDIYTAGYRYDVTGTQTPRLWSARWASPTGGKDEGVASELTRVSRLGHRVAFVAGRSYSSAEKFDTVLLAYDHRNGQPIWSGGPRLFAGTAHGDDQPFDLRYSDKTGILYVLGTSERGVPYGEDVVVMSYDAVTGEQLATAYVSGDIANGDDAPRGIEISPDGSRVLVTAEVHNLQGTGGRRAGVFAFDADLHPAGSALLASADLSPDFISGVDFTLAAPSADVVVAGASRHDGTGYDQQTARYPVAAFTVAPVATSLAFGPTASSVTRGSTLPVEVQMRESDGRPARDRTVDVTFAGSSSTVRTDRDGRATTAFPADVAPGTYQLSARFAGAAPLMPSEATRNVDVTPSPTTLRFASTSAAGGQYSDTVRLQAVLERSGSPVAGAPVQLAVGQDTYSVTTDGAGVASVDAVLTQAPGNVSVTASYAGSADYLPSSAATSIAVSRDDSRLTATLSGSGAGRTLTAVLTDADSAVGLAKRRVDVTTNGVLVGTAVTDANGAAKIVLGGGSKKQTYRASFAGDDYYIGSSALG